MIAFLLALAAPQVIAVHGRWGAFAAEGPRRCYAIAQPVSGRVGEPFASVATWPAAHARNQLHVRLSRPVRAGARVMLAIGERRFALVAGASDAWAGDRGADRAIVAAMRGGRSMSVESVGRDGRPFADTYALAGAATAIDAAALACL